MIRKLHNGRSLQRELQYEKYAELTMTEALDILKDPNNVIVAFRDSDKEYVIMYIGPHERIHGLYMTYYRGMVKCPPVFHQELNLLDKGVLDRIKGQRESQEAHLDGWLRHFLEPRDILCSGFRVYDVAQNTFNKSLLTL